MGAHNVSLALRMSLSKLSPHARDVFYVMALTSLDKPTERRAARLYFGGHVGIVVALGEYPNPARMRRLRDALRELRDAGLITLVGRVGHHYVYRIEVVDPVQNPVDNPRGPPTC